MIINLNKNEFVDVSKYAIDNLVIGYFDGIHLGHKKLFKNLKGNTCVLTFKNLVWKKPFLYELEDRIQQLDFLFHPEHIFVFDVMAENLTANEFVEKYLSNLNIKQIVVGDDFKFGKDQLGVDYLKNFFKVKVVKRDDHYSSTLIKEKIKNLEFDEANKMLVLPYYRSGNVIHNFKISRSLNYPTANLAINENLIKIKDGIYITKTLLKGETYFSTTFIGVPKTFKNITTKHFESFLIDYYHQEFYGEKIYVSFYQFIGKVKKYNSLSDLREGIAKQVQQTKDYFNKK